MKRTHEKNSGGAFEPCALVTTTRYLLNIHGIIYNNQQNFLSIL